MFSGALAPYFKAFADQRHYQEMASFLALFIVSVVLVNIIGFVIRKSLHISGAFGLADHIAGVGAGLAKGGLILALLVYPLVVFPGLQKEIAGKSKIAPELVKVSEYLMTSLAPGFTSSMEKAAGKLKSLKATAKTAEEYIQQIGEIKTVIKDKTERIKERFGLATDGGAKADGEAGKRGGSKSGIDESDRKELDKLINKLE